MKEATGELNLTIVVVIAVSLLIAFFYYVIWPSLDNNMAQNSKCSHAYCENPCKETHGDGVNSCSDMTTRLAKCKYKDNRDVEHEIDCPWKG